jgi:2-hydroxychromene-2-carboxylate isomerase
VVELFFDFVSPYSYLACTRARSLGQRAGREMVPRPVVLGAILTARGTKGPAEVPARRAYIIKDLVRAAHAASIELRLPPTHPFNSLLALRVAGLDDLDPARRWQIVDALFGAAWARGQAIDDPERVATALREAGIEDGASLVSRAATPEAKQRLREATDEAIARGAFGVPTLFADGEMFFGFDSFPHLEAFLRGADPAAARADLVTAWAALPASAVRRT